jgi:hypothetical protein
MATIRKLTHAAVLITTDDQATLIDPGVHTFSGGAIDLNDLGEVTRVLITHEHADHVDPAFLRWLIDRSPEVSIYSNPAVSDMLAPHGIEVSTEAPDWVQVEDVLHNVNPAGASPPNRAFTVEGVLTHPGDSREPTKTAPTLAVPLMVPWDSTTGAIEFVRRLGPDLVLPIHDSYLSSDGRDWVEGMARRLLAPDGIEVVDVGWGESFSV